MASPFARATEVVPVEFDPPHTITVKQLTARQLAKAQKVFYNDVIADVQARGGAKVQKEMQALFTAEPEKKADGADATPEAVAAVQADPLNGYDAYTLIMCGVAEWSYPDSLKPKPEVEYTADGREVTVLRVAAIDALTDQARDFFARAVMKLSKPELFLSPAEREAAQVKD